MKKRVKIDDGNIFVKINTFNDKVQLLIQAMLEVYSTSVSHSTLFLKNCQFGPFSQKPEVVERIQHHIRIQRTQKYTALVVWFSGHATFIFLCVCIIHQRIEHISILLIFTY